jgi:hypothetical protein
MQTHAVENAKVIGNTGGPSWEAKEVSWCKDIVLESTFKTNLRSS